MYVMETNHETNQSEVLKFGEKKDQPLDKMLGVRVTEDQMKAINRVAWRFHRDKAEVVRDCIDISLPAVEEAYMKIARQKLKEK